MKKPLLLLLISYSFLFKLIAQSATIVSVTGTSSTNTITNNVATTVDPGLNITADGNITGFTVMITGSYTSGDILAYTGTLPTGITASAFNTTSRSIQFTGSTSAANWQAFLRTVTLKTTSASCYQEQRQVSFIAGYKFYNNLNGHFYEVSASTSTWQSGLANAATQSYFGRLGYMATITSQAENSFISKILAADSWIGATDDYSYINTALGTTTYANQSASEGKWYWACGPEKGTQMSTANQVNISGVYNSWNGGEPNNAGNENFCEIYVASGNWNDLNGTQGYKSIIEYGGMSTDDVSANVVFTRNLLISGAPSGTIAGGNITVCSGTNSTTLTLTGLASGGTVTKWQYSYDDFLTAGIDIANTTTTYAANNITQNTYYRAVVNASGCNGLATSSTRIYVNSAVAGNIVADNNTICNGASVNFTLNGYSGSIVKWQVSTASNFSSNVTDISNTTPAMSYQLNTAGTYYFRAVVLSCSNTVYTNVYTINAIAGTAPVGGTVSSANYCGGSNSGTLTLSGYTGSVSKWQYSTDGGVVWTDVSNTTATLNFSGITTTRRYRAVLTNGSCGTALSAVGFVTVYSNSVAGTASGAATACAGTNSSTVVLNGSTGTIQWQSSINNTTFTDISGATSSSYAATNLNTTTYYRAVVTNGVCAAANSNTVIITVKQSSTSTTNLSVCSSQLPYTWNGLTFNAAGSQTKHLTNSVGCDSAATLNLSVAVATSSTTNISICSGQLPYTWNGLTFTVAGSQTAHLTNSNGCDSAATLNLSVVSSLSSTTNISICSSQLPYTWNGLTFTATGSQTANLTSSNGCDSAATLNLTVTNCNAICLAGTTAPCLVNSYVCLGTSATYNLTTITLTCTPPDSTVLEWHTGNPATSSNLLANPTAAPYGAYWAVYRDTVNNCYGNNGYATQNVTVDSCTATVTSGVNAGVESKTIGDIMSLRLYGKAVNSIAETNGYVNTPKFNNSGIVVNGTNDLTLNVIIPATVINTDNAYVTTPTDLVNFTNAVEVLAVDYTRNNRTKAVAFGTKTLGSIYTHTKPICDRLKGAELLEVNNKNVDGYNLVTYKIKQCSGETEYAINLSIGTATNRSNMNLQSNWFTNSYTTDEKMYNLQLWAVSKEMVVSMAKDIINRLQANGNIIQISNADLPKAYVTKGHRNATDINLTLNNTTTATNGYIELKEKATETAQETTRIIPFTIAANAQSNLQIPVKDNYEGSMYVYLNNQLTDLVYLNDGTWNIDYNKSSTTIKQFTVSNQTNLTNNVNEYKLMRNVAVQAIGKDYISIYKTIGDKCNALNLSSYKSLLFNADAVGATSVTVTLISNDISIWKDQYSYTLSLDGSKEYAINLNQFKSNKYSTNVNDRNITAVNFAFNTNKTIASTLNINLSSAKFGTATVATDFTSLTLGLYPNPNNGKFTLAFNSEISQPLVLKVIEAATGRVVKTEFITAIKGNNKKQITASNMLTSGNYIVTLDGDGVTYKAAKLIISK